MQLDPSKPTLKPPGTNGLNLKIDESLSTFAFKFNLRRYDEGAVGEDGMVFSDMQEFIHGRGLHSSTFQLNLSRF